MLPILTPEQVKKADLTAINEFNIPSIVLMENAARSAAKIIKELIFSEELISPKIAILCGSGNNGGDGFAIARHLHEIFDISIFWIGNIDKMSTETKTNLEICSKLDLPILNIENHSDIILIDDSFDVIIDALIGIGGTENIKGITKDILEHIEDLSTLNFAIDVPTGLNSYNGKAHEHCFNADYTVTMFALKTGLLINDGTNYSGEIHTAYLGAPDTIVENLAEIHSLEPEDLEFLLPQRKQQSSKFDYGKALIISGSAKYSGASALVANSCVKSGAGLTYLYTPKFHPSTFPEVIVLSNEFETDKILNVSDYENLKDKINSFDSIVIGPGLDSKPETIKFVHLLLSEINVDIPIVIDADAIRAIDINKVYRKNIILTPHIGEFSRMTGLSIEEININLVDTVNTWAKKLNCTILLKGNTSIISDGENTFWNLYGNPSLAKGGSGDVLSGILGALLAKNPKFNHCISTACGCLIHSLAADNFTEEHSEETFLASDLIKLLENIIP